jgi:hypothetical protein
MVKPNVRARLNGMLAIAREQAKRLDNPLIAEMWMHAVEQYTINRNDAFLRFMQTLKQPPVPIEMFLESEQFIGGTDLNLWPEVRKAIVGINQDWWRGLAHGANKEAILAGATGTGKCLPGDTEFLTPNGWKRIDEYTQGDLVASYSEDGSTEFETPLGYTNQKSLTPFNMVGTSTFSMIVTDNHRVVSRSAKTGKLSVSLMSEVSTIHEENAYGFKGRIPATLYSPSTTELPLTDYEIRLMVAVMADGSFLKDYESRGYHETYCTVHLKKRDKKDKLVSLLYHSGIEFNRYDREDGYSDISFRAPQRNKTYEGWWAASQEQLEVIREEILYWDGSTGKCDRFFTCDKNTAEFIQYVGSCTGSKTSINTLDRVGEKHGQYERKSVEYTIIFQKTDHHGFAKGSGEKPVIHKVRRAREYCFTVTSGMFVVRQNGHVFVTGNSELAKVSTAYHLHILGSMKKPQTFWGLPTTTSIVIVIQGAKPHVVKRVVYAPLRKMIEAMPWFQQHMRPNRLIEAEMLFDDYNIRVVQGGADDDAILGEAIISSVTDEINFMQVVEKSKKAAVASGGRSSNYDQAEAVYTALSSRKKGRFTTQGPNVGITILSSSTRYKNDFTDRRMKSAEANDESGIYIYNKAQYLVVPPSRFSGPTFRVQVADGANSDTRIMADEEKAPSGIRILEIPVEYKDDFQKDLYRALRDICGISDNAISPFFRRRNMIYECVEAGRDQNLENIVIKQNVRLDIDGMPQIRPGNYCKDPSKPRFIHIDLATSGDSCGIAMVRFDGFVEVERQGEVELLPKATVELAVSIIPDGQSEIDISDVRVWAKQLKTQFGYPVKIITYDNWQSKESRQQLRKQGIRTGEASVDKTAGPYKQLRSAVYDTRIMLPNNDVLVEELCNLEYDATKDKIDHPVTGSKDCADAVCGAYHVMMTRSRTWNTPEGDDGPRDGEDTDDRLSIERRFDEARA